MRYSLLLCPCEYNMGEYCVHIILTINFWDEKVSLRYHVIYIILMKRRRWR